MSTATPFTQTAFKERNLEAFNTVKCVVEVNRMCLFWYSALLLEAVTAWLCKPKYCLLCHCIYMYIQVFDSESTDSVQRFRSKTFSHDTLLLRDTLAFALLVTCNSRDSRNCCCLPSGLDFNLWTTVNLPVSSSCPCWQPLSCVGKKKWGTRREKSDWPKRGKKILSMSV